MTRRTPDGPVRRRCAYCEAKTTVTKGEARSATALSRTVHSPVWAVTWPPLCHETVTTYQRTAVEGTR